MSWSESADTLHRTVKLLLDSGKAKDPEEARRFLESLVLQVVVGRNIGSDLAAQAALLTVVNSGSRAFLGGVEVVVDEEDHLGVPWADGHTVSEAVRRFGGTMADRARPDRPTLAVGRPDSPVGSPVLHVTHAGWAAGIVEASDRLLQGIGTELAGVAAGALGVSEVFQRELGDPVPGRREVGVSLWRPDLHWRDAEGLGPAIYYLPAALWLLGLGHLGQAYSWVLGMLPYSAPADLRLSLVDFDVVVDGNWATQLLVSRADVGVPKTRVAARVLEELGFKTTIVERAFDADFRPNKARNEPAFALAGFDERDPRLLLGGSRFDWVIDGGLGAGLVEYLDILVHTFPGGEEPATAFPQPQPSSTTLPNAYEAEIARRVREGGEEAALRCGMLEIAGVTIGAAFVGAFAATLVVGDVLRLLHDGPSFSVVGVDLRNPQHVRAVVNSKPGSPTLAFTAAQSRGTDL